MDNFILSFLTQNVFPIHFASCVNSFLRHFKANAIELEETPHVAILLCFSDTFLDLLQT